MFAVHFGGGGGGGGGEGGSSVEMVPFINVIGWSTNNQEILKLLGNSSNPNDYHS